MAKERVLITGALGFVGKHLAGYALSKGASVHGLELNVPKGSALPGMRLHECDLRDRRAVERVIKSVRPSKIFHLAAQSSVSVSWKDVESAYAANIYGQINLFDAVLSAKLNPVIVVACSADEYGDPGARNIPVNEKRRLAPVSPYAVSKAAQDLIASQYHLAYGLRTVRIRAFHHTGPGRGENFAESSFAKQIALIEAGRQEPVIRVGNLSPVRDFTDVRDFVKAYWAASEKCDYGGVYNVCSGKGISIRGILDLLLFRSCVKVKVVVDKKRFRPADIKVLVGSSAKFRKLTKWRPVIPMETTMRDLLDHWRDKIARKKYE